jgi:hypothetical protein
VQWWVISFNPLAAKPTYQYYEGTKAGAQARAKLAVDGSVTGPFATKADAQAAVAKGKVTPPDTNTAGSVPNPLTGINAIGDLAHRLTESATWIRVGEFAAGALLLYIGLNALTRGTAVGSAVQSAKSGVKDAASAIR